MFLRRYATGRQLLNQMDSADSFALLKGRSTLSISGPDSVKFLQGLTTNQMSKIDKGGDGLLSAFLSPQVSIVLLIVRAACSQKRSFFL